MRRSFEHLVDMRLGAALALLTLLYGFGLGGTFGAFEDDIKGHLKSEGQAVLDAEYGGDEAALKKVTDKSWVYFKRAHLHANGLGTASLALILLLSHLPLDRRVRRFTALALGIGALGYPLFWMLSALRAPGMGGTGAAKESLQWLAVPSSGLCILGLVAVAVLAGRALFSKPPADAS